jgi:lipopolysaccharide/colanic/teichoic acid biosynthesis glycosyltransferase
MKIVAALIRIVVFGLLLIVLSPIFLLLTIWVRLDSPGKAIFAQDRLGMEQRLFKILKFRTMTARPAAQIDQIAEGVLGSDDHRITRAGRFLRRTSLDELPQLWNMLRGEMNIVGPRPLIPEQLAAIPPDYMSRFNVPPGLTGLAQVRGRRSLDWLMQLAADREYVENRNLWLDLKIIARTVVVVFSGSGVYDPNAKNWRDYLPDREP